MTVEKSRSRTSCVQQKMSILGRNMIKSLVSAGLKHHRANPFRTNLRNYAYEAEGKTTATLLNNEEDAALMINSYSQTGFRLNNGIYVVGPMAIFPRTVFSWNVRSSSDINEESLSLFFALDPKLDILVLGIGDEIITPFNIKHIIQKVAAQKINVEILPTERACATFNFLNSEGRIVAGGFIPPAVIRVTEDDLMRTAKQHDRFLIPE